MRRLLSQLLLAASAFLGGAWFAAAGAAPEGGELAYQKLAVFARVLHYVESNYVTPIDAASLIHGAIRGMVATLDPHSAYMDPEQFAAVRSESQGEFGGIGVDLVVREDRFVVVSRYDDSPARRAGVVPGDAIVAIDGEPTKGTSLSEVVRRIKGPPGSKVSLTLDRVRGGVEVLTLTRARIIVASVHSRRAGPFAYVQVRSFTERTAHDVQHALEQLAPISGLVLDLRDNPGGLLDQGVRVADLWISTGVIVSTEGRHRPPEVELAHPKGTEPAYPIVVLVNGGTASASEIVAGALQDHRRAWILGTQTFGKGSVQTVIELEDQSALKLTIARYFTPKHRSIQGTGITPDIAVPRLSRPDPGAADPAGSGADNQLEAALDHLRSEAEHHRPARSRGGAP